MSATAPADAFERCIAQRAQLRNQLKVAISALEFVDERTSTVPADVAAVVRGALVRVRELQDDTWTEKP